MRCDGSHETAMKEIDFLPEWYRTGQKRQVNYRMQCIVLSGVFAVMGVWSLATTRSISNVRAELTRMAQRRDQAESASAELAEVASELKALRQKLGSVEEIDSRIDVASVLAEISFLTDEMVVLSKVEFISEKVGQGGQSKPSRGAGAVVRAAQAQFGKKSNLPLGDVRFKITLAGVAAEASDVMALIRRLEESPYFRQVVLSFSRNAEVARERVTSLTDRTDIIGRRAATGGRTGSIQVSEFEINCYLGNYREL